MLLVLFTIQVANARESRMFNVCDQCRHWPASKTAHLLKALDSNDVHYELWSLGPVVILSSPKDEGLRCYDYFALFFDNQRSCLDFSRRLKIKCELNVTSITDD